MTNELIILEPRAHLSRLSSRISGKDRNVEDPIFVTWSLPQLRCTLALTLALQPPPLYILGGVQAAWLIHLSSGGALSPLRAELRLETNRKI